ncbi:hypothetical protein C8N24_6390 [Solirubrobacter pauli]|uniref:Uncharacterized protein n=1 Tax=Solirubrobacter pauli TaxID=166793 RepID=A0A660L4K8_9ACTN|nr:hypothetical protein [Solirubrobacter pauli]RKQ88348.1 hypothetical protein C8N24_6390 [Solirubrobacter pauli]
MTKLVTAVVVLVSLLAAPSMASAAKAPKPVRDCTADGRVDGRYSKSELRRAIAKTPKSSKGKECKKRLKRVLKSGGDGRLSSKSKSTKTILRDCADNGWIDRRYSVAALRKALKNLPTELEEYSDCGPTLRSEIKARTKKSKR